MKHSHFHISVSIENFIDLDSMFRSKIRQKMLNVDKSTNDFAQNHKIYKAVSGIQV